MATGCHVTAPAEVRRRATVSRETDASACRTRAGTGASGTDSPARTRHAARLRLLFGRLRAAGSEPSAESPLPAVPRAARIEQRQPPAPPTGATRMSGMTAAARLRTSRLLRPAQAHAVCAPRIPLGEATVAYAHAHVGQFREHPLRRAQVGAAMLQVPRPASSLGASAGRPATLRPQASPDPALSSSSRSFSSSCHGQADGPLAQAPPWLAHQPVARRGRDLA